MPDQLFDITVSDLETLPGADLQDGDRLLVSRPGAFDKTVTWGDVKDELGVGVDLTTLQTEVAGKAPLVHVHAPIDIQGRGQPNGFATLDSAGKIPILQIPDGIGGGGSVGGIEDVPGLQTALDGKAPITHTQAISTITGLQTALDGKAAANHGHAIADVTGLQTALDARVLSSSVGQASGVASLGSDGKIPAGQIPSLAIGETFVVTSESEMLALTAEQGDVARRTDTGQTFILQSSPATTLANWVQISATASVSTVNGQSGDVAITVGSIPGLQTALDGKAATAHVHSGADITSGLVSTARLGTGTPTGANFLRGDGAWVAPNVAGVTGLQTALDAKLATATNAASQGLVLTATGATAWEWRQPSGGSIPVDANGHPVIGGVAPVAAVDWRGGISEVATGFPTFSGTASAYRANSRRLYVTTATPRIHYTADASGLLAEGVIRNYCAYNTTVTGWTVVSASVAAASGVNNPGGTAGAVQVGSSLAGGYTQQSVVSVPTEGAGLYAVSGFFRAGSASVVTLWLSGDNGATFSRCAFDLTTGIATPDNSAIVPSNIRVERYPNGWWYLGFVAALASVATTRIRIYPGGLSSAVGTVVFWGTQIAPAAYVPSLSSLTSTAIGQKAIDTRFSTLTTPLTPADSASIYAEFYPGPAVDGCLMAFGVTTGSKPRLEIRRTASGDGGLIRAFNAAGVQVYSQAITLGTGLTRIALSASSDSTLIAVNGTTFTVAASLDWLAMTRVAIGTDIDLLNAPAGALFLRTLLYPAVFSLENLSALSLGGSGGGSGGGGVTLPIGISDVSGLTAALEGKVDDSQIAQPSGVASLDTGGLVPVAQLPVATPSSAGVMTAADKTKLNGVATGATANATDAQLRDRTTHTGTQAIATVSGLQTALDGKADLAHVHSGADITTGTVATARLGSGTANTGAYLRGDSSWQVLNVAAVSGLQTALDARVLTSSVGVAGGVATLDGAGKIPTAQIPSLAITDVFTVASEAAMLALTAQAGDLARRTDISRTFILTAEPATTLANWVEWLIPPDAVTSVAGKTGVVTLAIADTVGLQAALDAKAALTHTHVASDITSGTLATARLGTGTPSAANYLRGDGSWAAISQSEVTGLTTALTGKIDTTARGAANGVASLDASTLVPSAQIPTLALSKLSTSGATTGQVVTFNGSAIVWSTAAGGGNLTWTVRTANATLSANENCVADGAVTELTLPSTVTGSHEIINNTTNLIRVIRGGAATISGIARSTGAAIAATDRVRILPGQRGVFVASGGNWIAQGCEQALVFSYNGTPLANNTSNPLNASDLFHYLGIVQGGGTWTNPANTAQLVSAASAMASGVVANLTDRVASGQNIFTTDVVGSWFGWQFLSPFTCTGFWIQYSANTSSHFPRAFELRVNTGAGLANGANITGWAVAQSWTNQTQIDTQNGCYYFAVTTPLKGNQLAIRQTANATSSGWFVIQEAAVFGFYEG